MSEPIKHAPGPFWESAHCLVDADGGLICEKIKDRGDYLLLVCADHAPHVCTNASCPGDINRRKLELWPKLVLQLRLRCQNYWMTPEQKAESAALLADVETVK